MSLETHIIILRELASEFWDSEMNICSPSNFRKGQNLRIILKFTFKRIQFLNSIQIGLE